MKKVVLVFCLFGMIKNPVASRTPIKIVSPFSAHEGETFLLRVSNLTAYQDGDRIRFVQGSNTICYSLPGDNESSNINSNNLSVWVTLPKGITGSYHLVTDWGKGYYNHYSDDTFTIIPSRLKSTPSIALPGRKISVDITGMKTNFTSAGKGTQVWLAYNTTTFTQGTPTIATVTRHIVPVVTSVSVLNKTSLICDMTIPDSLRSGNYDIYVSDSLDDTIANYQGLYMSRIKGISPNVGFKGQTSNFTIVANKGTFTASDTMVDLVQFNQGTNTYNYASSVTYHSSDTLYATIPITLDVGSCTIDVYGLWNGPHDSLPNGFIIENPTNTLMGYCFLDSNYDSQPDSGEMKLNLSPFWIQAIKDTSLTNFLVGNNIKGFVGDTGTYIIKPILPKYFKQIVPNADTITFKNIGDTATVGPFALQYLPGIKDLSVKITAIGISRPGRDNYYVLSLANKGNKEVTTDLILKHDKLYTFDSASEKQTRISNDSVFWNLKLKGFEEKSISVILALDTKAKSGKYLHNMAIILPIKGDTLPTDNYDSTTNDIVRTSYDPNDKAVSPSGGITNADIDSGKYLDYTIRFQNTGNDTAFKVVVKDSISNKFDLTGFEMIDASHPYKLLYKKGLFTWTFDNILLPDSTTNEEQSHGFIRYKIKPSDKLTPGDLITNKAAIYFDYNTPVLTNETSTEVLCPFINDSVTLTGKTLTAVDTTCTYQWLDCNKSNAPISGATNRIFTTKTSGAYAVALTKSTCVDTSKCNTVVVTGTEELSLSNYQLSVYPNPTKGLINVEVASLSKLSFEVKVYDMMGQLILTSQPELVSGSYSQSLTLDLNGKANGIYLIECVIKEGIVLRKVVVE